MVAEKSRFAVDERHGVLQLIAEAEGAPGLVVTAARPQTAGERLVEKPTVGRGPPSRSPKVAICHRCLPQSAPDFTRPGFRFCSMRWQFGGWRSWGVLPGM